jgi:hypothetical protein
MSDLKQQETSLEECLAVLDNGLNNAVFKLLIEDLFFKDRLCWIKDKDKQTLCVAGKNYDGEFVVTPVSSYLHSREADATVLTQEQIDALISAGIKPIESR